MKIKLKEKTYDEVMALKRKPHKKPVRPNWFFRKLRTFLADSELKNIDFTYELIGMDQIPKGQPCLILMNHSSFIDLKIAGHIFKDWDFNIVCTSDGFVGKEWLMRGVGSIPTKKFITDTTLLRDMKYAVDTLHDSILMYPEASYSFDGTATPLPGSLGKCVKLLGIPVVMVKTYGAFARDPLYNNLQIRDVAIKADVKYLISKEDIRKKTSDEINEIVKEEFTFDNFRWQQENEVVVDEVFRADFLNRVLYKCPHCLKEGSTTGKGTSLKCKCGAHYELTTTGFLEAQSLESKFTQVADWYNWQRECVRDELLNDTYELDVPVEICMLVDTSCVYKVGQGRLVHNKDGFHLTGCDGKIDYIHKPSASYSLYADYYWYEIGDVICIGTTDVLYYCFPKCDGDVVAKTRLAAEELFKLRKS